VSAPATLPIFDPVAIEQGRERREANDEERKAKARTRRYPSSDDLGLRQGIRDLVDTYERAKLDIRDGFALISRATAALNSAFVMAGSGRIGVEDRWQRVRFDDTEGTLQGLERELWDHLCTRLELRRFMSVRATKELEQLLDKGDLPPLTYENVVKMADDFRAQIQEMGQEAVREVFEWLTPQNGRYKTNCKLTVPRRIVLSGVLERADPRWTHSWGVNHRFEPELVALDNVFSLLDGKGGVSKTDRSQVWAHCYANQRAERCEGATPYYSFRGFKNGALHVTFTRLDLLKRFNMIAGGARLKPAESETP